MRFTRVGNGIVSWPVSDDTAASRLTRPTGNGWGRHCSNVVPSEMNTMNAALKRRSATGY